MKRFHEPSPKSVAGTVSLVTAAALASGIAVASGAVGNERSNAAANERASGSPIVKAGPVHLLLKVNEFTIAPYVNAVKAGKVKITVFNRGRHMHEVLLVNAKGKLPMKAGRVDEAALERAHRVIGEIADVRARRSGSKTFRLKQGSYMLFCNLPRHYRAGMRASLIVRRR